MAQPNGSNLLFVARDYIKDYIVSHDLKSGDLLPTEKELSLSLGLSRTVIREALKGLQELGVTDSIQGKGHFLREFNFDAALSSLDYVVKPSLRSFKDLLEIRMYLESAFLARDVFLFTERDFAEIEAKVAEMEGQIKEGVGEDALINNHTYFHKLLYKHSGNMFLVELIAMFSAMQHRFISVHGYQTTDRWEFILGHRRILDALRNREPEMVRSALVSHFSEPLSWVRARMAREDARESARENAETAAARQNDAAGHL